MAGGEDPQRLTGERLVRILRRVGVFVDEAPAAGFADAARTQIAALRLRRVLFDQVPGRCARLTRALSGSSAAA